MPTIRSADHFHGRSFIFVHVPRTAGVFITNAVADYAEPYANDLGLRSSIIDRSYEILGRCPDILRKHITIDDLRAFYGNTAIDSFYSFAFLRNPWEWLVSLYTFICAHPEHAESTICSHMTFKQFLRYFSAKKISQHSFFAVNGRPAVSKVFRFEDMSEALLEITAQTGFHFRELPAEAISKEVSYREKYDHEDADLVRKAFVDDIELGGYTFDNKLNICYKRSKAELCRFIVDGTPRSGTTALMGALSMHPHCFCANERFQIFADHEACLWPESLANREIPPAYPDSESIIDINIDAYLETPLLDPSDAYPYLVGAKPRNGHGNRRIAVFGNKTPRYYFNALDICAQGRIKYVAITRHPLEISKSWNARAANAADAWNVEDTGLLGMMEYLQMCHALAQEDPENTFVVVYDHIFFDDWRRSIQKLGAFLGLDVDQEYLTAFKKYFVRKRNGPPVNRTAVNEGEALFCQMSGGDSLHNIFLQAGGGKLTKIALKLREGMKNVYENLDAIVKQYFESSVFYPNPEQVQAQILRNQSLFFARSRFQGLISPLNVPKEACHLKAWLTVILFWRRAFAASNYYSRALFENDFSDLVKSSFAAVTGDMPYIFNELEKRGLSAAFAHGITTLDPRQIQEAALILEKENLLEDAQILRYRAVLLARNEHHCRTAAVSFGVGDAQVQSRLGIGAGSWDGYLSMGNIWNGFSLA